MFANNFDMIGISRITARVSLYQSFDIFLWHGKLFGRFVLREYSSRPIREVLSSELWHRGIGKELQVLGLSLLGLSLLGVSSRVVTVVDTEQGTTETINA